MVREPGRIDPIKESRRHKFPNLKSVVLRRLQDHIVVCISAKRQRWDQSLLTLNRDRCMIIMGWSIKIPRALGD
jgi:hypothetical protein